MKPITLALKPSKRLSLLFTGITSLAIISVALIPLTLLLKISLAILILASYLYAMARHALLLLPTSIHQVHITTKGQCLMLTKEQVQMLHEPDEIKLLAESVVQPYLTTMLYQKNRWLKQVVMITPDNTDAEAYRALRVWLLWAKEAKQGKGLSQIN